MKAITPHQVRIIGGRHRGRRLPVADLPGLRPSGDRVRETLFNWLQPVIAGARCLDLFAGSGALGLEAASRGAGRVVMVDRSAQAARQLRLNVKMLGLDNVDVVQASLPQWLSQAAELFDIAFIDPPFGTDLMEVCCERLESGGWLTAGGRIYLETDRKSGLPRLPESWQLVREKSAGRVAFFLACRSCF